MLHIIATVAAWAQPIGPFYDPEPIYLPPEIAVTAPKQPTEAPAEAEEERVGLNGTWLDGRACLIGGECTSSKLQYDWAEARGLRFVHTSAMYNQAVGTGYFVRLNHPRIRVIARRPHVLATTAKFVYEVADAYHEAGCGHLVVTGAGRLTSERPQNGSVHSVHPAGMAVDLRVNGIGERCEQWLGDYLLAREADGEVDVTREYHPPHFHVVVPDNNDGGRVYLAASSEDLGPEQ